MSTSARPPRKHNPAWPDPPEARAKRQAKRLARLNEIARSLGFPTWRRLETAAIRGDVVLTVATSEPDEELRQTDGDIEMSKKITEKMVRDWMAKNRPDLGVSREFGVLGIWKRNLGPATGFTAVGKTWKSVALHLGMVEPTETELDG